MIKAISIIRIFILVTLGMFAVLSLIDKEQEEPLRFVCDKILSIGAIILIARLYKRWTKVDAWFIAYDKMCADESDNPNPMYLGKDSEG